MPKKPTEPFSTCNPLPAVKYQRAEGVKVSTAGSTSLPRGEVRTVVTTAQKGTLDLRYAPRRPKISDKNTAH
ncbi:MAG: hypothetical protein ACYC61_30605 [Isosphaeraceae bacterium]